MLRITAIGEILIDLTQVGLDENGIPRFAAFPGGAPANVAVAASKLGSVASFIGCVGQDAFGKMLTDTMRKYHVDTDAMQSTDADHTTLAVVSVAPGGERSFTFYRNPGADTRLDDARVQEALSRGTGILHFGSVSLTNESSRDVTLRAVDTAKSKGALISYDPNYRASLWTVPEESVRVMRLPLPMCDIVKISDEETDLLTGKHAPEAAAEELIRLGVKLVLITLGADGVYYRTGSISGRVPGFRVKVADTNGAGDTFLGAVLSQIAQRGGIVDLEKDEAESLLRFANCAASITTSRPGAIPAMPTREEVDAVLCCK